MKNIGERLDALKSIIQEEDFLQGKGLSNEVNIRIFCYDPKEEMIVRHFTEQLVNEPLKCNLIEVDLYKLFLKMCEDADILDGIPELEEDMGKDELLENLESFDSKVFAESIAYEPHQSNDVLMITGVGKVFPFLRVHALLEALQPHFTDMPVLVMYPGVFEDHSLRLFNKLRPSEYYRAFNTIGD